MDVYRQKQIPLIFASLPFIRKSGLGRLADSPDDINWLNRLQVVASGAQCISTLEQPYEFIVKCDFPDDILERKGNTNEVITWHCYYWKMWDVEKLFTGIEAAEAIPLRQAGIDPFFLDTIANKSSCIPLLHKTEKFFDNGKEKGYEFTPELGDKILNLEKQLGAGFDLDTLKGIRTSPAGSRLNSKPIPSISAKLRDRILRRDHYRCIFCGRKSPDFVIEVNHIIPKSLISKLNLKKRLFCAEENLCATCFDCNRGKSDNLAKEDISFYIKAFANPSHSNHDILKYLEVIRNLQKLG